MHKILMVVGTRPEAIKMAPLYRRLKECPGIDVSIGLTGQHREMVRQVFDLFAITPAFDLDLMQPNQTLVELTNRVLSGMTGVLKEFNPGIVLVHGDTTTTFAAALAAFYLKIPIGHVEAGLRTGDMYAPWPEEMNRTVTDAISAKLYAPTKGSADNLRREGHPEEKILITGNTVIDALLDVVNGPLADPAAQKDLAGRYPFLDAQKKMILVTCHRRESYGEGFESICSALEELSRRQDVQIVFPVHMNPNVRAVFSRLADRPGVHLIEPVNYLDFVFLLSRCHIILTDSGGIQEEAPSMGKPVFVLREVTERPEAVAAGTVKLVGTDRDLILKSAGNLLDDDAAYAAMSSIHNPYGDGKACERIVASLNGEFTNDGR